MKKKILIASAIGLNFIILGLVLWQVSNKPRFAYVDLPGVYDNFQMKKQLESKLDNVGSQRKSILDSLEIKLKTLASTIDHGMSASQKHKDSLYSAYENLRQEYALKSQNFTEDNERTKQQYNEQIWKQLNQYIKDYGHDNGYAFIFGADGSGSLMYGNDPQNITDAIKEYVNKRFAGEKVSL
jgi:outer membrane protein